MVGIATANDDIVYFMNNKTKKEDEIRGKIEDETSIGVKIKDKRSKDKEPKLIPGTIITRIVYDSETVSVVDFRKPDGKLGTKILGTISQVKDPCKELKIGRCGTP